MALLFTNKALSTPTTTTIHQNRVGGRSLHRLLPRCFHLRTTSRSDWQSSCTVISSNSQNSDQPKRVTSTDIEINGKSTSTLDLVPIDSNLPRPLTIADLAPAPMHGSHLRVAYQGVPGAYSEAAAGKAYPDCEAIPCDQFEVAFQAVELWIADRAVLPVENSLGGSIHRNYDLLLRHRLHIVGEVQLPVHHCLLALPGVKKENLARVISHPQVNVLQSLWWCLLLVK